MIKVVCITFMRSMQIHLQLDPCSGPSMKSHLDLMAAPGSTYCTTSQLLRNSVVIGRAHSKTQLASTGLKCKTPLKHKATQCNTWYLHCHYAVCWGLVLREVLLGVIASVQVGAQYWVRTHLAGNQPRLGNVTMMVCAAGTSSWAACRPAYLCQR